MTHPPLAKINYQQLLRGMCGIMTTPIINDGMTIDSAVTLVQVTTGTVSSGIQWACPEGIIIYYSSALPWLIYSP